MHNCTLGLVRKDPGKSEAGIVEFLCSPSGIGAVGKGQGRDPALLWLSRVERLTLRLGTIRVRLRHAGSGNRARGTTARQDTPGARSC